jgi:hypothetical protein
MPKSILSEQPFVIIFAVPIHAHPIASIQHTIYALFFRTLYRTNLFTAWLWCVSVCLVSVCGCRNYGIAD